MGLGPLHKQKQESSRLGWGGYVLTAATMIRGYVVSVRTLLTRGLAGPTWQVGVDEQGRGLEVIWSGDTVP